MTTIAMIAIARTTNAATVPPTIGPTIELSSAAAT